jgi:Tol biopolymer transport system component
MSDATGAVFLSYASQDSEAARRIAQALRAEGIEVWFDESALAGGEAWDASIRRQIRDCALFVAIVSASTQARKEGYFRLEWKLADERSQLIAEGTPFVLPVIIDGTKERDALVPKSFLGVQWTWLPHGEVPPAFAARVLRLLGIGGAPAGVTAPPQAASVPSQQFATAPSPVRATYEDRQPRSHPRWALPFLSALCLVLAAGLAWVSLRPAQAPKPPPTSAPSLSITLPPSMELVLEGVARSVDITPDGKTILFVAREGDVSRAYLRALGSYDIKPVPKSEGAVGLLAGPDGKSMAAFIRVSPDQIDARRFSLDGSTSVHLARNLLYDASWEAGNRLLTNGGDGKTIVITSTDGRGQTEVPGEPGLSVLAPSNLSDKWIVAHAWSRTIGTTVLVVVSKDSAGVRAFTPQGPVSFSSVRVDQLVYGLSPRLVAPGYLCYSAHDGTLMLTKVDTEKVSVVGEPRPVLTDVRVEPYYATAQYAVGADGTLAYVVGPSFLRGSFVWLKDGKEVSLGLPEDNYGNFRLSRDGRRLITVVYPSTGPGSLRVFDTTGQAPHQTVPDPAADIFSAWWPDSASFVYGSRSGAIVRRSVRDMAVIERVKDDGHSAVVDVSPDGKTVAVGRWWAGSDSGTWFMSWPDGKRTLVDADNRASFGSFSPDGKWFVYSRPDPASTNYVVHVVSVAKPSEHRMVTTGFTPTWSAEGREILFGESWKVWAVSRTGEEFGKPRVVYDGKFLVGGQVIETHPDGRILLAVPKPQPPVREIRVIPNWLAKVTAGWK